MPTPREIALRQQGWAFVPQATARELLDEMTKCLRVDRALKSSKCVACGRKMRCETVAQDEGCADCIYQLIGTCYHCQNDLSRESGKLPRHGCICLTEVGVKAVRAMLFCCWGIRETDNGCDMCRCPTSVHVEDDLVRLLRFGRDLAHGDDDQVLHFFFKEFVG